MAAWAYHQEHPSSWAPFSGNESSQLEAAFDDQATTECELQGSDWRRWRVDQVRMKLLCVTSGTTRAICRRKYPSADAARWEWQGDAGWQRYDPYLRGRVHTYAYESIHTGEHTYESIHTRASESIHTPFQIR